MPTYLKELLDLPDRVMRGDFVLKLSEGVEKADETIRTYVFTPQIARCFDQALNVIKSGVQENTSKGCYLHGSFGSGKSHFMAILNLLLQGNTRARSIPELAAVVSGHNSWTQGRKFFFAALSHDRQGEHGAGHPGWICRLCEGSSSGQTGPRHLPV